jgi:hypothetical protein
MSVCHTGFLESCFMRESIHDFGIVRNGYFWGMEIEKGRKRGWLYISSVRQTHVPFASSVRMSE